MMTALGKLFRTTAFKLTLVYLTVFALFAVFLLGYFALNTKRLFTEQVTEAVDAEITGLVDHYNAGGIRRLTLVVEARSRRPGFKSLSRHHAAAATALPAMSARCRPAFSTSRAGPRPCIAGSRRARPRICIARWCGSINLPGGFKLLVGRDLEERDRLL